MLLLRLNAKKLCVEDRLCKFCKSSVLVYRVKDSSYFSPSPDQPEEKAHWLSPVFPGAGTSSVAFIPKVGIHLDADFTVAGLI